MVAEAMPTNAAGRAGLRMTRPEKTAVQGRAERARTLVSGTEPASGRSQSAPALGVSYTWSPERFNQRDVLRCGHDDGPG